MTLVDARAQAEFLEKRLAGVLSAPRPGTGAWAGQHTSLVDAGRRDAASVEHVVLDDLGCVEKLYGAATGEDWSAATVRAYMEALERYAAVSCVDQRSVVASRAELGDSAIPVDSVPRHGDFELGRRSGERARLDETSPLRWVAATRWKDRTPVLVPSVMAFNVTPRHPVESFWVPVSTGTAAHFSLEQAVRNGLLEVVERDAVALTWLSASVRPTARPPVADLGDDAEKPRAAATGMGGRLSYWDMTTDLGVPAVLALLELPRQRVRQVVGAAARTTFAAAAAASGAEALQIHSGLDAAVRAGARPPRGPAQCRRVHDGALLLAPAGQAHRFRFLSAEVEQQHAPRIPDSDVARWLDELGHDVYVVDLTPPDVAGAGVAAVRVIVPSLQPMSPVFGARYLASRRVGSALGLDASDFNPMPYPLA